MLQSIPMNWMVVSAFMAMASAVVYLAIRKLQLLGIPTTIYSFVLFGVPVPLYLLLAVVTKTSLIITPWQLFVITITAVTCSWLGNQFSMRALTLAPNPGYSLIISKSYVVLTSVAAVFLFQSELTRTSVIAIGVIIASSALITLSGSTRTKDVQAQWQWLWYTLGAFFCWSAFALSSTYQQKIGISVPARLFYSFLIVSTVLSLQSSRLRHVEHRLWQRQVIALLTLIGLTGAAFNYLMQVGYQLSPNPGYISAVNAGSITLVTIGAVILFKDEFNLRKMIGVFGVTAGLALLFLG